MDRKFNTLASVFATAVTFAISDEYIESLPPSTKTMPEFYINTITIHLLIRRTRSKFIDLDKFQLFSL